jgi:predicted metal-dependent HD superfamily phosphohydrolase
MLDRVDELAAHAENLANVQLAAFYHDAVYDPTRGDNEQRSAKLAEDTLPALGVSGATVADIIRLVLLTATHDPADGDADGAVLCDADLAVLAGTPEQYAAYASGVRDEYAHVDEPTFRHGRAAVLKSLLSRPRLYRTEHGFRRWEAAARHNLATELALLTSGAAAGQPPTTG